jgi:soluble lytic murein transglycosylase-like protein
MRFLLTIWILYVFFIAAPSIPGSATIPADFQAVQKAIHLDQILEAEYNTRQALISAHKMDSDSKLHLYSADALLDLYYRDPVEAKRVIFKMNRTRRVRLLNELIDQLSDMYGVNSYTIKAIAKQESHYNPKAISDKGAIGIMQLMPGTAKQMGVRDITNPVDNIIGGIKYVKHLAGMFSWKTHLVLAAYNAGPHAVIKHRGIPPYDETKDYVKKVIKYRHEFKTGKAV